MESEMKEEDLTARIFHSERMKTLWTRSLGQQLRGCVLPRREDVVQLAFVGDTMLGRLVDQTLPHPTQDEWEGGRSISALGNSIRRRLPLPQDNNEKLRRPWGNCLSVLHQADARFINLETSVTRSDNKWPGKMFNYRMHPGNVDALKEARIDYASLANNHVLDYGYDGMKETIQTLATSGIKYAGAGKDLMRASEPRLLEVKGVRLLIYSFSDHGCNEQVENARDRWAATMGSASAQARPGINYIDNCYKPEHIQLICQRISREKQEYQADIVVFSVHWGPNYSWMPSARIVQTAHRLIDLGEVDIVHGHSSHHIQGVEIYKRKLIIYGCGDFVDDYAVDNVYRNDLGGIYLVNLDKKQPRIITHMTFIPCRISQFQVNRLLKSDKKDAEDYRWLLRKHKKLSKDLGAITFSEDPLFSMWHFIVNGTINR